MREEKKYYLFKNAPLLAEADVVVIGGGPAGVATAETAARFGLRVLLVEKNGFLGGQAVGGLSATICGLYLTNEDWQVKKGPRQIVYGFAERFRCEMKKYGGLTEPQLYGNTYVDAHEPFIWKIVAENMLCAVGVKIMYHTVICDAVMENKKLTEVYVLTAHGYGRICAKNYIDASGDAVLVAASGGMFRFGNDGIVQNPSFIFKLANVNEKKFWDYYGENTICHKDFSDRILAAESFYKVSLPRKKIWIFRTINSGEIYINATSVSEKNGDNLNCLDVNEVSYAEIIGKRQAMDYARFLKEYIPGCEKSHIGEHASSIGIRQTRSVVCKRMLHNKEVEQCVKFQDGIAKSSWPIELHRGSAPKLVWLKDDYYEIPFDTMVPIGYSNLLVAGRCIDAEHEALASCRVTAQCFAMGHAAGIAAALAMKNNINFDLLDGRTVREYLDKDGANFNV